MMTLPLCALLFLPLFLGLSLIFPWIHPATPELRHLVHEKSAYLNVPFYTVRYVIYFAAFSAVAIGYRRLSLRRGAGQLAALATMKKWSGPCLILLVLLLDFVVVDWVMSLKPEWSSSMLVVEFGTEQLVSALAWGVLILRFLSDREPLRSALTTKVAHDLGNLLLALTCFWTYVTFSEYLITWTGNLPHDVVWFSDRSSAGWKIFAAILVFAHFVVPLFCLILTSISRHLSRLAYVAGLLLFAHYLQVVWWVQPGFSSRFTLVWSAPLLLIALGALWLSAFLYFLQRAPLLPASFDKPEAASS